MLKKLSAMLGQRQAPTGDKFAHIMAIADMVAQQDPLGLRELVRALLRPLQAEHLVAVAEHGDHGAPPYIEPLTFFFDLNLIAESREFLINPAPSIPVRLDRDTVLPTPWKRSRYANALGNIGIGRKEGAWKQDENHHIAIWLPWKIAFVTGGNHSIAAGILSGHGELTADEVLDLSPLFKRVTCDGRYYRDGATGKNLSRVRDYRRAAVFEIGRMIAAEGITDAKFNSAHSGE